MFNISQNTEHYIPRSYDGSREQKRNLWFDEEDVKRMCIKTHKLARRLRSCHLILDDVCTRGIEHLLTQHATEQRLLHKDIVIRSVLQEQSRTKINGKIDSEAVASVSKFHSRWSADMARSFCKNDSETFDEKPVLRNRFFYQRDSFDTTRRQTRPNSNTTEILTQAMSLH